jgi:hypothetical protein
LQCGKYLVMLLCPNQKIQLLSIKCSDFKFYLHSGFQSACNYFYDITNLISVWNSTVYTAQALWNRHVEWTLVTNISTTCNLHISTKHTFNFIFQTLDFLLQVQLICHFTDKTRKVALRQVVHQVLQFPPVVTAQLLHIYVDIPLMICRLHTPVMLNPTDVLTLH